MSLSATNILALLVLDFTRSPTSFPPSELNITVFVCPLTELPTCRATVGDVVPIPTLPPGRTVSLSTKVSSPVPGVAKAILAGAETVFAAP